MIGTSAPNSAAIARVHIEVQNPAPRAGAAKRPSAHVPWWAPTVGVTRRLYPHPECRNEHRRSPGSSLSGRPDGLDAGRTMRLHPRSLILAAALIAPVATLAACGDSDKADPPPAATAAPRTLGSDLRAVVAAGSPGVIALVNDGHKIHLHAAGVADTATKRAMGPTDRFRAGSTAKSFVSTVALQLVGERQLSLSDTVERWLPGILPYGDQVTLRQLLNLTSGVPDHVGLVEAEWLKGNMMRSWSPRELIALLADKKPDFAPGTSWAYSNTNYLLAGLMIERVTGHDLGH